MAYRRYRAPKQTIKDIEKLSKKISAIGVVGYFFISIFLVFVYCGIMEYLTNKNALALIVGGVGIAFGIFLVIFGRIIVIAEQKELLLEEEKRKNEQIEKERILKEQRQLQEERHLDRLAKTEISEVDKMSGIEFEEFLKALYIKLGYNVKLTKKSGDFGADLIIEKNGIQELVQAKCYTTHKVSLSAIQEITGAKKHYQINNASVVTNNYFTEPAKQLASENGVKLIDRVALVNLMFHNELRSTQLVPEITKRIIKSDNYNDLNHDSNFSTELYAFENKILNASNAFNVEKTRLLLKDFYAIPLKTTQDYLTYHFGIARIISMIYRLRDSAPNFIHDIYELCNKDIEILPLIAEELKNASVPALTKKAILLTKENKLNEVIELCDFAIKHNLNEESGITFAVRKDKILQKINKESA